MEPVSLALQAAIVAALEADSQLADLMGGAVRVFDPVPSIPEFPYIRIGSDEINGTDNSCAGGSETFARIHIYSRKPGYEEVKRIGGRVRILLDVKLVLVDHYVTVHETLSETYSSPDKQHEPMGELLFRFKTWESPS